MKTIRSTLFPSNRILRIVTAVLVLLIAYSNIGMGQEKLRAATCQFPVSGDMKSNSDYIKKYIVEAAQNHADILHFSEAVLTGYPPGDIPSFENFDWNAMGSETNEIMSLAKEHKIWVILGSAHYLGEKEKPLNCLYMEIISKLWT